MAAAVARAVAEGFTHVAFGDLFLEDVRRYREERLAGTGLTPLFPLFGADTAALAREMIAGGLGRASPASNPKVLDRRSPAASSTRRCSPSCRPASIRAASAASFTRSPTTARCSRDPIPIETGDHRRARRLRLRRSDADCQCRNDPIPSDPMPNDQMTRYPARIVCLTEETTETLYLLGQGDRIVGVSGYTVRPPEARQKPKVSAFINARFDKIEALDRIWCWRSRICRPISRRSWSGAASTVVTFNQRSVAEILQMIRMLGGLVGCQAAGRSARRSPRARPRSRSAQSAARFPAAAARVLRGVGRPADLGHPLGRGARRDRRRRADFPGARRRAAREGSHRRSRRRSRGAIREVIFASWCGKKVKKTTIRSRPGWDAVGRRARRSRSSRSSRPTSCSPVRRRLTEGVRQLHDAMATAACSLA